MTDTHGASQDGPLIPHQRRRRDGDGTGGILRGTATYEELRARAVALRRRGLSRRQIRDALKVHNNDLLNRLVADEPPPAWTRRPNAKDDLRLRARELRTEGKTYDEIRDRLGVSKSSISAWVRDLPKPPPRWRDIPRMQRMETGLVRHYTDRDAERRHLEDEARRQVGKMSDHELLLVGAALYWAEGQKDKPYARRECVTFTNSDPDMIRVFVRFLEMLQVGRDRWRCSVHIHASEDVGAATSFWAEIVGLPASDFMKPWLKKNISTRLNRGPDHRGCLTIRVTRSARLYRRIEGWWCGIVCSGRSPETANRT
ncbi:hypothetical protein RM572_28290 [Streptomyces sp. DSM 42041]|uniref:Homeodomain-like domain-containing protein n=1 Tax=Streptomyces hazeniae TaxID=3075538 RepID=A0ABU2P0W3_9ACTN|nr:hypothetical protein [Streptomyces sp. DSM 42041]MDT0382654.1 hypothetical protein [Streptomyces sp. DSM 42041]